jgi:peptidoglycan/xylan/chitin deacetylase (PgdA/CDA1 family)
MRRFLPALKKAASDSGALRLYHKLRNRRVLTVLMLHRVLPGKEAEKQQADPVYTIDDLLLVEIGRFISAHYNIVSLRQVVDSRRGKTPLPPYPLLITFDDGWQDNITYAAPVLAQQDLPWAMFVAADAPDAGASWWQEELLRSYRSGRHSYDSLLARVQQSGTRAGPEKELALLEAYGATDPVVRAKALEPMAGSAERHIASWSDLRAIQSERVEIGVHGASHLPLTSVDPRQDLTAAKSTMQNELGPGAVLTLSFPHGRYNGETCAIARSLGFELLFTSDPKLNRCQGGFLSSDLIGRMSIETCFLCDEKGQFDAHRAERWFFLPDRMSPN